MVLNAKKGEMITKKFKKKILSVDANGKGCKVGKDIKIIKDHKIKVLESCEGKIQVCLDINKRTSPPTTPVPTTPVPTAAAATEGEGKRTFFLFL